MTCSISPSLCTAAAKGDTDTVEKHLQNNCCYPFSTQYFIDPDSDARQSSAIVGLCKRKRVVTVCQKNGDNSANIKPATPLQVALYYKEEGVLFLLLNHFLKISSGNVARCYDETAEAIAATNGYSHLMEFFVYYDSINRESFGSCWTEAMRHICDLTTKVVKYKKQVSDLTVERDVAHKERDEVVCERDTAVKERAVALSGLLEQKDKLLTRMKEQLREKDIANQELQNQMLTLREMVDKITGNSALEALNKLQWEARVTSNENNSGSVEIMQVTTNPNFLHEDEPTAFVHDLPTAASNSDSISRISHCIRHHVGLVKRVQYLKDYIEQCRSLDESCRRSTSDYVADIDTSCAWPVPIIEPELKSSCALELQNDQLQLFEAGSDGKAIEQMLHELSRLQSTSQYSLQFADLLDSQLQRVKQIKGLLQTNDINNEACVGVLHSLLKQLQQIFTQKSVGECLGELSDKCIKMEGRIEQSIKDRQRSEETGSVLAVERELNRQMDLQRRLLDFIKEKLDVVSRKAEELDTLSGLEEICKETLEEVTSTMSARNTLRQQCLNDHDAIARIIAERNPETENLRARLTLQGAEFVQLLAENDRQLNEEWNKIASSTTIITQLHQKRLEAVRNRVASIMEVKRKEKETELFLHAAGRRADQLSEVGRKCKVSVTVCKMIIDCIMESKGKVQEWNTTSLDELQDKRMNLHKEFYHRFRDWYLTHGEYTHKKKMLLSDIQKKIQETTNLKRMAVQRLDASAEQHGEMLQKLEAQRQELENQQIPRLEDIAQTSLPLFEPTKQFLIGTNTPFTHPECDLQQSNERREAEVHMSEVNKYQESLIRAQQALLECSNNMSQKDRVYLLHNHAYIVQQHSKLESIVGREINDEEASQLQAIKDENKKLKEQLQAQCVIIPVEFLDPITWEIMTQAVTAGDGTNYEKESIEKWLSKKKVSPKTNEPLTNTDLILNMDLMKKIQDWKVSIFQQLNEERGSEEGTTTTTTTEASSSIGTTTPSEIMTDGGMTTTITASPGHSEHGSFTPPICHSPNVRARNSPSTLTSTPPEKRSRNSTPADIQEVQGVVESHSAADEGSPAFAASAPLEPLPTPSNLEDEPPLPVFSSHVGQTTLTQEITGGNGGSSLNKGEHDNTATNLVEKVLSDVFEAGVQRRTFGLKTESNTGETSPPPA